MAAVDKPTENVTNSSEMSDPLVQVQNLMRHFKGLMQTDKYQILFDHQHVQSILKNEDGKRNHILLEYILMVQMFSIGINNRLESFSSSSSSGEVERFDSNHVDIRLSVFCLMIECACRIEIRRESSDGPDPNRMIMNLKKLESLVVSSDDVRYSLIRILVEMVEKIASIEHVFDILSFLTRYV